MWHLVFEGSLQKKEDLGEGGVNQTPDGQAQDQASFRPQNRCDSDPSTAALLPHPNPHHLPLRSDSNSSVRNSSNHKSIHPDGPLPANLANSLKRTETTSLGDDDSFIPPALWADNADLHADDIAVPLSEESESSRSL